MLKNSKKLIAFLCIATIGVSCFTIAPEPICVQAATIDDSITYDGLELRKTNEESFDNVEITTYSNIDNTLTYSKVIDNEKEFNISFNSLTNELTVNGETEILDLQTNNINKNPLKSNASEVYECPSSGYIPWRETVAATAVIVQAITKIPKSAKFIASLISAEIGFQNSIYYSFDQYRSTSESWSSYHNCSYYKRRYKNIKLYSGSISSSNVVAGPYNSSWFDPIRAD